MLWFDTPLVRHVCQASRYAWCARSKLYGNSGARNMFKLRRNGGLWGLCKMHRNGALHTTCVPFTTNVCQLLVLLVLLINNYVLF